MGKELPAITDLKTEIKILDGHIVTLAQLQSETNDLLRKLAAANNAFIGTLTSFLDLDHRLKLEQDRKRLEQAKSMEPTKHDLLY